MVCSLRLPELPFITLEVAAVAPAVLLVGRAVWGVVETVAPIQGAVLMVLAAAAAGLPATVNRKKAAPASSSSGTRYEHLRSTGN
jgi:hypothetical protein